LNLRSPKTPGFKGPQVTSRLGLSHHLSVSVALGGGRLVSAPACAKAAQEFFHLRSLKRGLAQDCPRCFALRSTAAGVSLNSPTFTFQISLKRCDLSQPGAIGRSATCPKIFFSHYQITCPDFLKGKCCFPFSISSSLYKVNELAEGFAYYGPPDLRTCVGSPRSLPWPDWPLFLPYGRRSRASIPISFS